MVHDSDQRYLEDPVTISLVHLETLDGHGKSQVFPTAYFREPAVMEDPPYAYKPSLKNI